VLTGGMKARCTFLTVFFIALAGAFRVDAAAIIFLTETTTELTGSFSFTDNESLFSETASTFRDLPGPDSDEFQRFLGERNWSDAGVTVQFGVQGFGFPDDPYFFEFPVQAATNFPEILGTYTNSPTGRPVNFRFYDFVESSGVRLGTFSGKFSFQVSEVPDSGATLGFLGLGLVGLGMFRRRAR